MKNKHDPKDPFSAGQMVGMLVILTYIENNGGISEKDMFGIKEAAAQNLEEYFDKPVEDILLMISETVGEIPKL